MSEPLLKIKEVIVVEGKDDTAKLKQVFEVDTIETNGSAINKDTLAQIAHAKDKRGVIVFTDPDYPGQRIRQIINQHIPGCKHAFLTREEAASKRNKDHSLGIEHASFATLRQALSQVYELDEGHTSNLSQADLMDYGLIGGPGAKERRIQLSKQLRIGHPNGKQLLKRLQMFKIDKEELEQVIQQMMRGEANE
nr:ribonuclease M5 [Gracilibacillus phocaeensis]